jgi:(2Fe-2S) ferredoxin
VTYGKVTPTVAKRILKEHVLGGKVVQENVIEA